MTFMPASIAFRFDPVIVQNPSETKLRALLRHVKFSAPGMVFSAEPAVANAPTMTTARSNPKIVFAVKLLRRGLCRVVWMFMVPPLGVVCEDVFLVHSVRERCHGVITA